MMELPINSHCATCELQENCIANGLPERCYINNLLCREVILEGQYEFSEKKLKNKEEEFALLLEVVKELVEKYDIGAIKELVNKLEEINNR